MKTRIKSDEKHYHFPIKDFATPSWWYTSHQTSAEQLPPTDWSQLTHIMLSDFGEMQYNSNLTIDIVRLRFTDSISKRLKEAAIGSLSLFIVLLLFAATQKESLATQAKPYIKQSSEGYTEEEAEQLIIFLGENYGNPLMSLELIRKKMNLTNYQISEIIRNKYNLQYKQYLNELRIGEAKRLLIETKMPIAEIAEKVGYVYANSFARTFRQVEGMTPNQFRKEQCFE